MWVPRTAAELEDAIANNTLPPESATYEYKQQLPPPGKNTDIAVDVSAMTGDGGVIIYGVGENKQAACFFSAPIQLHGVVERISQTIESNVKERPDFKAQPLPIDGKPGEGYVVVEVPASLQAPHMVEVKDEYRHYGRSPGGNRILTQQDLDRLYERRRRVEQSVIRALDDAVALAPFPSITGDHGDLHLVARPLLSDTGLRMRVFDQDSGDPLRQAVLDATNALRFQQPDHPAFDNTVSASQAFRTLEGVVLQTETTELDNEEGYLGAVSRLEFLDDGTLRYFRAQVAESVALSGNSDPYILHDSAISQMAAHFVLMAGQLLHAAAYHGPVDILIGLTGARGAISSAWINHPRSLPARRARLGVPTDDLRGLHRARAEQMLEDPISVTRAVVARLNRLLRADGMPDPLELA